MKMWRCTVCGLLYDGENPPSTVLHRGGQGARGQEQVGMKKPFPVSTYCLNVAGKHYIPAPVE